MRVSIASSDNAHSNRFFIKHQERVDKARLNVALAEQKIHHWESASDEAFVNEHVQKIIDHLSGYQVHSQDHFRVRRVLEAFAKVHPERLTSAINYFLAEHASGFSMHEEAQLYKPMADLRRAITNRYFKFVSKIIVEDHNDTVSRALPADLVEQSITRELAEPHYFSHARKELEPISKAMLDIVADHLEDDPEALKIYLRAIELNLEVEKLRLMAEIARGSDPDAGQFDYDKIEAYFQESWQAEQVIAKYLLNAGFLRLDGVVRISEKENSDDPIIWGFESLGVDAAVGGVAPLVAGKRIERNIVFHDDLIPRHLIFNHILQDLGLEIRQKEGILPTGATPILSDLATIADLSEILTRQAMEAAEARNLQHQNQLEDAKSELGKLESGTAFMRLFGADGDSSGPPAESSTGPKQDNIGGIHLDAP